MDTTVDRLHDLVVFGATGFTGRLVAEHLKERGEAAGDWAIAGRNPQKLERVAGDLGIDVPQVVVDSTDPDAMAAMAASTRVVCTTVGPYARFGEPVISACAEHGTDYVDLAGEPQWIRRMIDRYHDEAVASGARIVHCCGFDSIPSDLGTLYAQTAMQDRHGGVHAEHVRLRVKGARGGTSGGTLASMVQVMEEAAADPEVAAVLEDPYSLLPAGERNGPHVPEHSTPEYDDDFASWIAPFVMELVNAKVVRRSNALLGYPWGREFRYDEAVLTGDGLGGRARATAIAAGTGATSLALTSSTVRGLADRFLPDSGSGPDRAAREAGFFDLRILAEHPQDRAKDVLVRVTGDRDPGYGATSRMLGEAALALAQDESEIGGGSWTPASALGHALIDRLQSHAGITFEVR